MNKINSKIKYLQKKRICSRWPDLNKTSDGSKGKPIRSDMGLIPTACPIYLTHSKKQNPLLPSILNDFGLVKFEQSTQFSLWWLLIEIEH
jgi:hypothetical protein